MKNNRVRLIKDADSDPNIVRVRNRLIRRYNALRREGGWRSVRDEFEIKNVATVYSFAIHGIQPRNAEERIKLGIDKVKKPRSPYAIMPSYFNRTPEALNWFLHKRQLAKGIAEDTKKAQKGR